MMQSEAAPDGRGIRALASGSATECLGAPPVSPTRRRRGLHAEPASPRGGLARDPIEDQDAVEVVDLVLDHARVQTLGLDAEPCRRAVTGAHAHLRGRSTSTCTPGMLRQPSSAVSSSSLHHSITGFTSAVDRLSVWPGRRALGAAPRPAWPPDRRRARPPSARPSARSRSRSARRTLDLDRARPQHRVAELAYVGAVPRRGVPVVSSSSSSTTGASSSDSTSTSCSSAHMTAILVRSRAALLRIYVHAEADAPVRAISATAARLPTARTATRPGALRSSTRRS